MPRDIKRTILKLLAERGEMTDQAIEAEISDFPASVVRSNRHDLRKLRYIEQDGTVKNKRGLSVAIWTISDIGINSLKRRF